MLKLYFITILLVNLMWFVKQRWQKETLILSMIPIFNLYLIYVLIKTSEWSVYDKEHGGNNAQ